MVTESTRAITAEEVKKLRRESFTTLRLLVSGIGARIFFIVGFAVLAAIGLWNFGYEMGIQGKSMRDLGKSTPAAIPILGVLAGLTLAGFILREHIRDLRELRKMRAQIAASHVRVLHVSPEKVLDYNPWLDSHAPAFFFDVGDGTLLLMCGPSLIDMMYKPGFDWEFDDEKRAKAFRVFPNTDFVVEYDLVFNSRLSIKIAGQYLDPYKELEHLDWVLPPSDRLFPGRLESLETDLAAASEREGGYRWVRDH